MLEGRRHHDHVGGLGTAERRHGRRRATRRAQRALRHEGRRGGEERKHRGREVERIWMILTRIPDGAEVTCDPRWGVKFSNVGGKTVQMIALLSSTGKTHRQRALKNVVRDVLR